jgi:hypothetical protein
MGLNFSKDFDSGAELFLQAMGIKDKQKQQEMMNRLHQAQLSQAELQNQPLGSGIIANKTQFQPYQYVPEGGMETGTQTPTNEIDYPQTIQNMVRDVPRGQLPSMLGLAKQLQEAGKPMKPNLSAFDPQHDLYDENTGTLIRPGVQKPIPVKPDTEIIYNDKGEAFWVDKNNPNAPPKPMMYSDVAGQPVQTGQGITETSMTPTPQSGTQFVGKTSTPKNIPSAGNAVDLAIKRKFGSDYLTNPEKSRQADAWLATPEGRQATQQARDDLTPPGVTFLQTSEGFVPVTTKGAGIGNVGEPTGLGKVLPSEMVVAQQQIGTLKETLSRVKSKFDPNYVGPIGGRAGMIKEKWVGLPEKQSGFYADVAQIKNSLIYLMSGKQINEQEYTRLKDQLPSAELPAATFKARMNNFDLTLDSIIEERRKNMGGYGSPANVNPQPKGGRTIKLRDGTIIGVE